MVGGLVTGGRWSLANTLVLPPHQHSMDGVSCGSYLCVCKTHPESGATQQQLPASQGLAPSFHMVGGQGGTGKCTGCSAVQSPQPGMGTENADGEETALKN